MNPHINTALDQILAGKDLTESQARDAVLALMDGSCEDVEIAAFLTALRVKNEAVSEIAGAAAAMRERVTPIKTQRDGLLDTCGTGGDQLFTFNISTATALVAAGAGVPVAKHGNRSVSSSSGSADVLESLGVNVTLAPDQVAACIDEVGIGFCFAPLLHGAIKYVMPVRRQLEFRTIFNLLGPLTNPASAQYQLLGAGRSVAAKLANALARLGGCRAFVVAGADGLDEISLWGDTQAFEVVQNEVIEHRWTAASFGLPECAVADLRVESAEQSAAVIRAILDGKPGAPRDIVVANTAAALLAAEQCSDLQTGVLVATTTIDSGKAGECLQRLIEFTLKC
jgi:anthranilate phosphoribosyltransferase